MNDRPLAKNKGSCPRRQKETKHQQQPNKMRLQSSHFFSRLLFTRTSTTRNANASCLWFSTLPPLGRLSTRPPKTALVIGSHGATGMALTRHFRKQMGYRVLGADVALPNENDSSSQVAKTNNLEAFVRFPDNGKVEDISKVLCEKVSQVITGERTLDVIVCAAGGVRDDPEERPTNFGDDFARWRRIHMDTALATAQMLQQCGTKGSLVAIICPTARHGEEVVIKETRHALQTLTKTAPADTTAVALLPHTLDTLANRHQAGDPAVNVTCRWTQPFVMCNYIGEWAMSKSLGPANTSLGRVITRPARGNDGTRGKKDSFLEWIV